MHSFFERSMEMLVLSRKKGQALLISLQGETSEVVILKTAKGRVELGIYGSKEFRVVRKELLEGKEPKQQRQSRQGSKGRKTC